MHSLAIRDSDMKAVIALGGNALTPSGKEITIDGLVKTIDQTARTLARLAEGRKMAIVFGSGPQVGALLLKEEIAKQKVPAMPLDVLDAEVQGQLGYLIGQSLWNHLNQRVSRRQVVSVVTQIVVKKTDPAFQNPTKPVGPFYSKGEAQKLQAKGWVLRDDAGRGFRRMVASPKPVGIVEIPAIQQLIAKGVIVLAAGGGGIPVVKEKGKLKGVEAVIDKDLAAALIGKIIGADLFLIVTSVDAVYLNYRTRKQKPLRTMTPADARRYLKEGHFAEGSMKPKIEAALAFLRDGGKKVIITDQKNLLRAMEGRGGTIIF